MIAGSSTQFPLLSLLLWLPLAGVLLCLLLRKSANACRWAALLFNVVLLGIALWIAFSVDTGSSGWLLYEDYSWIERFGIRYTLGLDGISLLLVILTAFLQVIAVLISWQIDYHPAFFYALVLMLGTAVLGVFLALDLVLFYLFWELMLIPMFVLIGVWGQQRRVYAAVKFFFFTLSGSLLMLLAMISLYLLHGDQTGVYTFALDALKQTELSLTQELIFYICFMSAFAVKVPLFPFHAWLPDAHEQAPAAGSVDLAGLVLKTGVYGIIRFAFPLFPNAAEMSLPVLALLALIGLFYAAAIAFKQTNIKRLVAYSSVSHLGFVILGLAAWNQTAWEGSLLLMVNHGITSAALFVMLALVRQRTGSNDLANMGGLWQSQPKMSAFFLLFAMASLGLPGLANFAGEILILIGTFASKPVWASIAVIGVLLSATYMLRLVQGVIWGPCREPMKKEDLLPREWLLLIPLALLVVWLGCYPQPLLDPIREPVTALLQGGRP
ncbi:NADH dehydrogenase subunit M [Malonomonas rubra DSM 5091]|uniref:NADH dehydrogenase subunit M n=1 Tax=Malonomonas rubra DSM 5091 TaxID=1122189 RepID=A0A1M6FLY8_MALRU|nr:NADH-quinone oxidoreductase subunit M [Malonomonas rubra]SHI98707.1 NADH dehydrogenase subunit M [Malonomonas rubra DSM 5091]